MISIGRHTRYAPIGRVGLSIKKEARFSGLFFVHVFIFNSVGPVLA